jgi:hypothetical protein
MSEQGAPNVEESVSSTSPDVGEEFCLAETEEEKREVYRFRYEVYVEEMGRYRGTADHQNRWLVEPEDEYSRIFYARQDGRVVACSRLTWGGDAPFSRRQIEQYDLEPFLAEVPVEAIAVGERAMVVKHLRGTDIYQQLGRKGSSFVSEKRIQLLFAACEPHLLSLYLGLGSRTYARRNINSPEAGYLIPIVTVTEDVEYFRRIGAPRANLVKDFGNDARIPPCVDRLIVSRGTVTSGQLHAPESYWTEVYGALSALKNNRLSAFDGLPEDGAVRCLGKSNIIECQAGDRVLKKGGVARNLFVVLSGTLEVRDGESTVNVIGPGEVFGEIAFLLGRPRSMDVYAVTDDVRILSLSESTIRQAIERNPEIAAKLLLNMSKMLCMRLLQRA